MSKHNLINKKIKKQVLYINNFIENVFNNFKYFIFNYKKIFLSKDNIAILILAVGVILTLSYFTIPTFYEKNIIKAEIKNQISKSYNFDIKFNEKLNYGLLPKPHFYSKNLSIIGNNKEIGNVKNLKVFIEMGNFLEINKISPKDLVFDKADFNISLDDLIFFKNLLKTEPNENKIIFKKSNIFFRDLNNEVLFINKIKNGNFFYDSNNLRNVFNSKNEVFNVPYKITFKNDKFNKKFFIEFNSKKIRLKIDSETDYDKKDKTGFLDVLFVNKNTSLEYKIGKNSLSFTSEKNKNNYDGLIDFKPFYFLSNINYEGISFKNLLNNESILFDLIRSELFNNMNLNVNINLNVKDIVNINELNNLFLKVAIEQGDISLSNSNISWKDALKISLKDSFVTNNNDEIILVGKINLDINNINSFYSSFQVNKNYRRDIKEIQFDFVYNFAQQEVSFDNIQVDKDYNSNIDEFINNFNSKRNKKFNKITFKNFVNNFFKNYAG